MIEKLKGKTMIACLIIASLMVCCVSVAFYQPADDSQTEKNDPLAALQLQNAYSVEIPLDELSISDEDLKNFFGENDSVYYYLDENGDIAYELSKTIDAGRTDFEWTNYGYKVWLDSDLCYAIATIGLGALAAVPGIGEVATLILAVAGIGTTIVQYIDSNYLHLSNGICVEMRVWYEHRIFGVTFYTPATPPHVQDIYSQ